MAGEVVDAARIEAAIEAEGFELVALERGGGRKRPLLRVRIDRPDSPPGRSTVTVDDCAHLSRILRDVLESGDGGEQDWILEVSSPGVERPLVRSRDYDRFAGQRVRVRGYAPLAGRGKEIEGALLGLVEADAEAFALDVDGERVEIPLSAVASARLVYSWDAAAAQPDLDGRER